MKNRSKTGAKTHPKEEPKVIQKSIKKGVFLWIAVCRATGEENGRTLEVFLGEKKGRIFDKMWARIQEA